MYSSATQRWLELGMTVSSAASSCASARHPHPVCSPTLTSYLIIHQDQTVRNRPRPSRYAAKHVKYPAAELPLRALGQGAVVVHINPVLFNVSNEEHFLQGSALVMMERLFRETFCDLPAS